MFLLQGGRFMSTAMFSAKEAMIPGSVYDRSTRPVNGKLHILSISLLRLGEQELRMEIGLHKSGEFREFFNAQLSLV